MGFACGPRQYELLKHRHGEADLAMIDGKFYLFATCEIEEPDPIDISDMVGVDLGVTNIAVDSSGHVYASSEANNVRHRNRRLRQKLQKKGTKSAKRLLRKRSKKESRFAADVNHMISKRLVEHAQGTGCGIALEDLKHIRTRVTVRKRQRATLHSWSFDQLRQFIRYKAQRAGIPVVLVDPRNTSRTCPRCGCVDKRNRVNQATFSCIVCGFSGLADLIAAENIRVLGRAFVNMPNVSPSPSVGGAGTSCLL
jgi:putative transposase